MRAVPGMRENFLVEMAGVDSEVGLLLTRLHAVAFCPSCVCVSCLVSFLPNSVLGPPLGPSGWEGVHRQAPMLARVLAYHASHLW